MYKERLFNSPNIRVMQCAEVTPSIDPFYLLQITSSDKDNIYFIIHTLAKSNMIKLGLKKKELRKRGDKIQPVHPLRFISYVMGEGGLRSDMRKVKKSSYKWNNFMEGLSERLKRDAHQDNLNRYVPGFAHSLGVNANEIQSLIDRRDWHGLVNYFL